MEDFRNFFEQDYQGTEAFINQIISPVFGNRFRSINEDILDSNPNYKPTAERANILSIIRIGLCDLDVPMEFFDITLNKIVNLSHSRVYIQQLLRQLMETYSAALIVFHYPDNKGEWRVSYISKGSNAADATSAKRYTYLMGANQKCRTAADRFAILANKEKNVANITEAFSVETLTKEFYKELFDWYQWALSSDKGFEVTYPNDTSTEVDDRKIDEHIIRLITRIMFVWFIKQKSLVPETIFKTEELKQLLTNFDPLSKDSANYYNAILQNLFFATLNKPINEREFASLGSFQEQKEHYGIKTFFRDAKEGSWFKKSKEEVIQLFNGVPFLNGGLFECLDKENADGKIYYYDGFSRVAGRQKRAFLPNCLFFDPQKGLIPLLDKYNFTVEENTPSDVEVALDPELLGKVFENLLGAFNPETKETARKQSGSFYTPREIVNYMVDESMIAYLTNACSDIDVEIVRRLFSQDTLPDELKQSPEKSKRLAIAIKAAKMLDPACGSGAFPMGMLNRMLDIVQKLENNSSNYETKLYLIEHCIYGIDIQTIAVQITKLRFFISLICEQTPTKDVATNYGIIALPNLETKFVAANTLIGLIKKPAQGNLFEDPTGEIEKTKLALNDIRHKHFSATNAHQKKEYRKHDAILREKLAKLLEENGDFAPEDALQLSTWYPYDQNTSSKFFDTEWMFGIKGGFDMVVGNPPYVDSEHMVVSDLENRELYAKNYTSTIGNWDLFVPFIEIGIKLGSILSLIIPNKLISQDYAIKIRQLILEKQLIEIRDYSRQNVFPIADVYPVTILLKNCKICDSSNVKITTMKSIEIVEKINILQNEMLKNYPWDLFFLNHELSSIFIKLLNNKIQFKDFLNFSSPCTVTEAYQIKDILIDSNSIGNSKKLINSGTIDKYVSKWGVDKTTYIKSQYLYPIISDIDIKILNERRYIQSVTKKVIIANMTSNLEAFLDINCEYLAGKSTVIGIGDDSSLFYIVSLLNSNLISKYYKSVHHSTKMKGGALSVTADRLGEIPLPKNDLYQEAICEIAKKIIQIKSLKPISDTSIFEQQIDNLVYKLYDLTYDEVKVVEPDFGMSEEEYAAIVIE